MSPLANTTAAAAAAAGSQSAAPASGAQSGSADTEDPISTDATTPSTQAHTGHSSAHSDGTDGSDGTAWCALALLQSAAASLAIPCQPAGASAAGATTEQQDQADAAVTGGPVTMLAGATGAGPTLPATPPSAGTSAPSPANASTAAKLVAGQALSDLLPGTGAGSGNGVTGTGPNAHGTAAVADATGQSRAAARAASWMPQFLAAVPAAAGSDGVARAISVPMSDPSWPQALAAQVHWMAGSQVQSATLSLSPQHLGPIQVRIDLQQSQINVNFSAAHADTRAALADAMPRLREMLAAGGLSLGQANVQQQSTGNGSAAPPPSPRMHTSDETVDPVAVGATRALGLVDEYV